jgi:hypothetical protein
MKNKKKKSPVALKYITVVCYGGEEHINKEMVYSSWEERERDYNSWVKESKVVVWDKFVVNSCHGLGGTDRKIIIPWHSVNSIEMYEEEELSL